LQKLINKVADKKSKKVFDFKLLRRVLAYAKPYKQKFYIAVTLAIIIALVTPIRPILIQKTIDDYIKNDWAKAVVIVTILQIGVLIIETIIRFYFSYITSWLGQNVIKDIRVQVYKKALQLNLKQFDTTPIGTLTTRTINDIEAINDIFSDGIIPIIADLLSIIVVVTVMFFYNWQLTLAALSPFPIIIIATYYFKESVNKSFIKVRNAISNLNSFVQEHIGGMQIVQSFAAEKKEYTKFTKINDQHRDANIKAIFAYSVFFPVVEIVLALSIALMVWKGAAIPVSGGVFVLFILLLNAIFRPLRVIADKFNVIQMGMVASERVFKLIDNEDVTVNNKEGISTNLKGNIIFENVSFAYIENELVLKNISFKINTGDVIAIVGATGSGKTTIISLLNKLYNINEGTISIDGINIDDYAIASLRKNIGVVLQDIYLFSDTIYNNITLWNNGISKEQVIEATKLIGLHDFIMKLPNDYDYNVLERGATLSVGQRQLISFVRALLYNPSILILDEATSSVDTESETLIQHAIDTLIQGRTSIIIAHRLSTIQKATKIIVLDKGEIKEMGTHQELLAKGGFYTKLHSMQFGLKQ
jgi:ATP-binding cassette, subfamily B, multidrug efflux pump